jgi:hypothetical protein
MHVTSRECKYLWVLSRDRMSRAVGSFMVEAEADM